MKLERLAAPHAYNIKSFYAHQNTSKSHRELILVARCYRLLKPPKYEFDNIGQERSPLPDYFIRVLQNNQA